ncbi:cation-transporting P-type ATPase [Clostridium sp.]|uniref:P-type ATPase n=1 Tax=Clostridium sp. TaxID=1506 RepID=UPI003D6CB7C6
MKKWYGKTMTKVVEVLDSDIKLGLNENKIEHMRETYGDNIILKPKIESLLNLIIKEMAQLWNVMYTLFIIMLFFNNLYTIGYIATFTMLVSFTLLILGDYKEEKNLKEIDNLNVPFALVIRSGKRCKIGCEEVVVGDIVFLEKGNYVPADIRLIETHELVVRQVAVTGEKYEVEKYSMKIEGEIINLSQIKNIVFKSSVVTEGYASGIVIATGMDTQIGKILKALLQYKNDNRFFSKSFGKIANKATIIAILSGILTLGFTLYKKIAIHKIINELIYIFMSFNFPVIIIILLLFFYIISAEFKKKNIYIKDISTMFFLSNISAIFTKKIGAISENEFILRKVYCDNGFIDVEDQDVIIGGTLERIISIATLCGDAKLCAEGEPYGGNSNSIENFMEYAICKFCSENLRENSELQKVRDRIFVIPYDSDRRIKTVVNKMEDRYRANVQGNLDGLLNKCTHILINGMEKEIKDTDIENIINVHIKMSNSSYNVIGLGYRNFNYEPSIDENIESNLVFVGLMGFENPIKKSAYAAIKTCEELNIRLIIDEGDNKLACLAFGKLIGLTHKSEQILSGIEIDYMSSEEFEKNIEGVRIFSKISSKHKNEIVNLLNNRGYSIASLGDNTTDLEYLNNSRISISTGSECSNVVRKLSSLYLQENDLSEIINLVQHSKKIINYISELVLFLCVTGTSELFIILVCLITKGQLPFSFIEILFLNFIIVPFCGLSILLQNRNSVQKNKNIDYHYIKRVSIVTSLATCGIYFLILISTSIFSINNIEHISTLIFSLFQNLFTLKLLYEKRFSKNKISYILMLFNLLLQIAFIFICFNNFNF